MLIIKGKASCASLSTAAWWREHTELQSSLIAIPVHTGVLYAVSPRMHQGRVSQHTLRGNQVWYSYVNTWGEDNKELCKRATALFWKLSRECFSPDPVITACSERDVSYVQGYQQTIDIPTPGLTWQAFATAFSPESVLSPSLYIKCKRCTSFYFPVRSKLPQDVQIVPKQGTRSQVLPNCHNQDSISATKTKPIIKLLKNVSSC